VEQKDGAIERQFVGYDRFEGVEPCRILAELYRHLRLYINFFRSSLKLISKKREGSRVIKKYDRAPTSYQRVLAAESMSVEAKEKLEAQFVQLELLQLLTKIKTLQDQLWPHANVRREIIIQPPVLNGPASTMASEQRRPQEPFVILISRADESTPDDKRICAPHNGMVRS